jgi:hypothetical protein
MSKIYRELWLPFLTLVVIALLIAGFFLEHAGIFPLWIAAALVAGSAVIRKRYQLLRPRSEPPRKFEI